MRLAFLLEIDRNPAGNDAVAHQAMAEGEVSRLQDFLAQDSAMRVDHGERSVVADRAEIAEMIGDPLQLRHQRA